MKITGILPPLMGLTASLFASFILSAGLLPSLLSREENKDTQSVVGAILGKSRLGLSSHFYEMADLYLHRGVGHVRKNAFDDGFFQGISREISPEKISHASGQAIQEMIPWLWLAVRSDPHNQEAYLVAAFLASGELGQFDIAHQILAEARWNNPKSYQIQMEDGRIYYKERKYDEARKAFDIALAFWAVNPGTDPDAANYDKASILLYKAMLLEKQDDKKGAVRDLREIIGIFPDRTFLNERVESLEKGLKPSDLATRKWNDMLKENEEMKATCHTDHEDDGGHTHADGQGQKH